MSEPLILIPGLACDARVFFHQIVSLSLSRGVTVVPLKGALVEEMSQAVLAQAPPRFALAGQGLGGHGRAGRDPAGGGSRDAGRADLDRSAG